MTEPETILQLYNELVASGLCIFPLTGKVNVSSRHGVYIIYDSENNVLLVGMTPYGKDGLNQRLYNHISKTGVFYRNYLKTRNICLRGTHRFRFIEVDNPRHRALLEALTAGFLCPAHFGTGVKM